MGARRPIDHLGGRRSRRPTPLPRAHRWPLSRCLLCGNIRLIPRGRLTAASLVYSGPDIGTTFSVKAVTADAAPHALPALSLTRGARHLAFLPGGEALVLLRGEIQHKDLWLIDLKTGAQRQLTNLPPDFDIRDFDISPDGREVVLERVQERSDVVLLDLPRR